VRVLITAGPTREPIDPVRYLTNRSSGKMGYALAEAARDAGHEVVLVTGPVRLEAPRGVEVIPAWTAAEMFAAVGGRIGDCDAAIFAAAVSDYTPAEVAKQKIKKTGEETMTLELVKTRDILGSARGEFEFGGLLVGFAAETENVRDNAIGKMRRKGCDFMVANDVSRKDIGFDGDQNEVVVYAKDGLETPLPKGDKREVAKAILNLIGCGSATKGER
jgi:phosphopantothenoylcysteine synthetase/decarboxylase